MDTGTQLITAVNLLPGNAWDSTGASGPWRPLLAFLD